MATSTPSLDDLRRRIDEIDDQLHDLIMRRAEIVEAVAGSKRDGKIPLVRPGREALILRRLVKRHRGRFPRQVLVRIWREMISGAIAMQGKFAIGVYEPQGGPGYWDLARDHFGSHTPMTVYHSAGEALRAVSEDQVTAAVLPMPEEGAAAPWWPLLAWADGKRAHVIARLPFGGWGNARGDKGDALVVGRGDPEATGADRSLLVIETQAELSRARLIAALSGAKLTVTLCAVHEQDKDIVWNLIEVDDLVLSGDPRLADAIESLGDRVRRVSGLGAYAKPLDVAALKE